MYEFTQTAVRFVWDIYAEIGAAAFASPEVEPATAAELAAKFADEMCIQRAARFPPNKDDTKKKKV